MLNIERTNQDSPKETCQIIYQPNISRPIEECFTICQKTSLSSRVIETTPDSEQNVQTILDINETLTDDNRERFWEKLAEMILTSPTESTGDPPQSTKPSLSKTLSKSEDNIIIRPLHNT